MGVSLSRSTFYHWYELISTADPSHEQATDPINTCSLVYQLVKGTVAEWLECSSLVLEDLGSKHRNSLSSVHLVGNGYPIFFRAGEGEGSEEEEEEVAPSPQ